MDTGAVALIDALGFRGIWGRHDPSKVLAALKGLRTLMQQAIERQFASQPWMRCRSAFLSDTIAVSMSLREDTPHREAMSAIYLADVISWALAGALRSDVPLAYRGAIAIGEYEIEENFLIGRAIDEAAEAHERAQGAVIFLTPNARQHVASWLKDQPKNTHLVKFNVPLKGGDEFDTYAVSPLEQAKDAGDGRDLSRTLLSTFVGGSMDVAVKLQNTSRFLDACSAWRGWT